eukprot:CAMPEP_0195524198 /NCGR_PEP_ID=MMETSP0794_2-20130614/23899_1 /TAXON_ID=515487 /ORGANISM="Stephanopyxis turris, Strain CCMP 815" /LENGTH=391 /DNA_ID=CAMNT_0040654373 /DNA_START=88 /DNA_END=1259 /DNA_ORIENTATION=+
MPSAESMPVETAPWGVTSIIEALTPWLFRSGAVCVGLASIAIGLLYAKQDSLLYFPEIGGVPRRPSNNPRRYRSPSEHSIPHETHMIPCQDGISIHSWLLLQKTEPPPSSRPTIIFFHGNAGNIGLRLPNAIQMYQALKCNVFLVEYRGFGDSDDTTPNESGLKLDSEAALRFLLDHPQIDSSKIFVFGRSLGGGVGFHLASYAQRENVPLAGLIVENTFLSIAKMVDTLMPLVAPLKGLILRIGWDSSAIAPTLSIPVLYLAGGNDQLVPHSHMKELYALSGKRSVMARMHVVPGGTHNETWLQGGNKYWQKIMAFITDAIRHGEGGGGKGYDLGEESDDHSSAVGASVANVEVLMGTNDGGSSSTVRSSIPTIPGNMLGMAKEAATAAG